MFLLSNFPFRDIWFCHYGQLHSFLVVLCAFIWLTLVVVFVLFSLTVLISQSAKLRK